MIYFIRGKQSGYIKIGYTGGDGQSRLAQLQTGSPEELELLATTGGGLDTEKQYHEMFSAFNVRGEWFEPKPHLAQLVKWLQAGAPLCEGKPIRRAYIAGKITGTIWRDQIVPGWSNVGCDLSGQTWREVGLKVSAKSMCGTVHSIECTGPYWSSMNADHCSGLPHIGDHACGEVHYIDSRVQDGLPFKTTVTDRSWVVRQARIGILSADLVFAWIDSPDCYGTLVEIGYALALGKVVRVAFDDAVDLSDLWFADVITGGNHFRNVGHAWDSIWHERFCELPLGDTDAPVAAATPAAERAISRADAETRPDFPTSPERRPTRPV